MDGILKKKHMMGKDSTNLPRASKKHRLLSFQTATLLNSFQPCNFVQNYSKHDVFLASLFLFCFFYFPSSFLYSDVFWCLRQVFIWDSCILGPIIKKSIYDGINSIEGITVAKAQLFEKTRATKVKNHKADSRLKNDRQERTQLIRTQNDVSII